MIRMGLLGCGRWGIKLLGALERHPAIEMVAIADCDSRALRRARELAPDAALVSSIDAALTYKLDALCIATPSALHGLHGRQALEGQVDVFIEKPMTMSMEEANTLCQLAHRYRRVGMVGHVLQFHPAVRAFIEQARDGAIGTLQKYDARRWTQSRGPKPLWTLAPHDISTLRAIDSSPLQGLEVSHGAQVVQLSVWLASGLEAHIELSTVAIRAERVTTLTGSGGALLLDELSMKSPLRRVTAEENQHIFLPDTAHDALFLEIDHFVDCIERRRLPRTSLQAARDTVEVLAKCEQVALAAMRRRPSAVAAW